MITLLDFLHYSVDNVHLRYEISKVKAKRVLVFVLFALYNTVICVPTIGLLTVLFKQSVLLRKEVIQPHLPIRLPCYDFTPIANPTFGSVLIAVRLLTSGITGSHGVTGGVYKARERIHRGMLIRDY